MNPDDLNVFGTVIDRDPNTSKKREYTDAIHLVKPKRNEINPSANNIGLADWNSNMDKIDNYIAQILDAIDEITGGKYVIEYKGVISTISSLPTVSEEDSGNMYTVTTGGTTTDDFIEGAGKSLQDGENVVAVNTGTESEPVMKWDILGGVFNITDRLQFVSEMPADPADGQTVLYLGPTTYAYSPVTPEGDENPSEEGWYELVGSDYELSEDVTVDSSKTYFIHEEQYVKSVIYVYNEASTTWVAQNSGDTYMPITDAQIDALFE